MIKFYDLIISMGYTPDIESLREIKFEDITHFSLRDAFFHALHDRGYTTGQAKKLVLDLLPERNPEQLYFLFYLDNIAVTNFILEIANSNYDFYPITRKLINQYFYNRTEVYGGYTYIEFRNHVEWIFTQEDSNNFIAMVRESPILKLIYYADAESKVRSSQFGVAKSDILLQTEAFKYETAEMFSKIRDIYRVQNIGHMDEIVLPYEGNVLRTVRRVEALRALSAANSL
jgi:hypothetical protein